MEEDLETIQSVLNEVCEVVDLLKRQVSELQVAVEEIRKRLAH